MNRARLTRSGFLELAAAGGAAAVTRAPALGKDAQFTQWGWPQPYERVSDKSVAWLKSKGWWPLRFGYQPPWMVEGTVPPIIVTAGLDKARGLDIEIVPFLAGPPLNEAIVAGTLQIGNGGDFPITSLILANAPVTCVGYILTPVLLHAIMVRPDSPMSKPEDLKGKSVGLVAGSSAEFALVGYLEGNGIDPKDVSIKTMPIPDQATFPRGIDAVLPWDPTPELMLKYLKNARIFADTGPYQMYWGATHVRKELAENAPDVVQAIADMLVEATMWQRLYPDKATDIVKKNPSLEVYPRQLLYDQNVTYASMLKPTEVYPFTDLYAIEGARIAKFLYQGGRAKRLLTEQDYLGYFGKAQTYMNTTFKKLGWSVPKEPPFFPPGVTVATYRSWIAEKKPFKFIWPYDLAKAQPFPARGDLQRPWTYAGRTYRPG
jgi:ABC-type nitrate/sulfonate/bicarbonate transport system substrate-binding protein